jgi:ArsR family transcriptional regulator, zinc-responsive transcriptional repressor
VLADAPDGGHVTIRTSMILRTSMSHRHMRMFRCIIVRMDPTGHTPERFSDAAEMLRALGHPARLRIAIALGEDERCVHELIDLLGLPQPAVSQHLQVLRAARVVAGRRVGREVRYALADHHIAHIAGDALTHAGEHHEPGPAPAADESHPPLPHPRRFSTRTERIPT